MNGLKIFAWLLFMPPFLLLAQKPDFEMLQLHPLESGRGRNFNQASLTANVSLYCDGQYLSLVVEVKDPRIQIHSQNRLTDQIELWMALPQSAYPSNFEFQLHPHYISSSDNRNARSDFGTRVFSTYAEYRDQIELAPFIADFDYPSYAQIQREQLQVPSPSRLKKDEIHYGIVHYGLFSDGRPAVLYNRAYHQNLEEILNVPIGDLAEGITYTVDYSDDGYIINAQISCQAIGFVPLPYLDQLRFMVDISDARADGARVYPTLSTSPKHELARAKSFNQVYFSTPLYTNKTQIPDHVFESTRFHPIYMYSTRGWVPTSIDTDALVYKEQKTSKELTEIKFSQQYIAYKSFENEGLPLESLKVAFNPVNALKREREYLLVQGQVLTTEWTPMNNSSWDFENSCFQFPDGAYGMIVRENQPFDPFGWGECGNCIQEKITVYRIGAWNKHNIVSIQQGNGPQAYCQIEDLNFDDYLVTRLDWIRKGKILVVRLDGQTSNDKKRIKISWNASGNKVKVEEVE